MRRRRPHGRRLHRSPPPFLGSRSAAAGEERRTRPPTRSPFSSQYGGGGGGGGSGTRKCRRVGLADRQAIDEGRYCGTDWPTGSGTTTKPRAKSRLVAARRESGRTLASCSHFAAHAAQPGRAKCRQLRFTEAAAIQRRDLPQCKKISQRYTDALDGTMECNSHFSRCQTILLFLLSSRERKEPSGVAVAAAAAVCGPRSLASGLAAGGDEERWSVSSTDYLSS